MPKASKKSNRLTFPIRLHGLLKQAEKFGVDHIISWNDDGTKFIIHNQKQFVAKILPNIFKQSKFASFRRQLNAYGFERVFIPNSLSKVGEGAGALIVYTRENFTRDDPSACELITRRYSNQALAEGLARLSKDSDVTMSLFNSTEETNDISSFNTSCPQECLSNTLCVCVSTPINEDAAIVSEDESVGSAPSLVRSSSETSVESFVSSRRHEYTANNDPYEPLPMFQTPLYGGSSDEGSSDPVLDEILALFDNDSTFPSSCESANAISWDPLIESLTC